MGCGGVAEVAMARDGLFIEAQNRIVELDLASSTMKSYIFYRNGMHLLHVKHKTINNIHGILRLIYSHRQSLHTNCHQSRKHMLSID